MLLVRNILAKPIVIGLIGSVIAAAAAPAAQASPASRADAAFSASAASRAALGRGLAPHPCTPSQPSFTSLMATSTVSCREARALNTYMTRHETLSGRFVMHGETWQGTVSSRAQNETDMVYRDGAQTVWITYGGPAS